MVNHIHRLLAFTVLAVISVSPTCAQTPEVKPPEKRSFRHGVKIFQDYNLFTGATLVFSKNIRVAGDKHDRIEMSAEFSSPGKRIVTPSSILLKFISISKTPRYDFSTRLMLVVDGEEISFGTTRLLMFILKDEVIETMVTPLPYQTFLKVANARAVWVKLGPTEFGLNEKPMEVLRDVASRTVL